MIKKYLELCTSHLTEETVNSLNTVQPPYSYQYPYGVFIIVPDRSSEEEFADFFQALPNDLQIVLKYAYEHDIELILLDLDSLDKNSGVSKGDVWIFPPQADDLALTGNDF